MSEPIHLRIVPVSGTSSSHFPGKIDIKHLFPDPELSSTRMSIHVKTARTGRPAQINNPKLEVCLVQDRIRRVTLFTREQRQNPGEVFPDIPVQWQESLSKLSRSISIWFSATLSQAWALRGSAVSYLKDGGLFTPEHELHIIGPCLFYTRESPSICHRFQSARSVRGSHPWQVSHMKSKSRVLTACYFDYDSLSGHRRMSLAEELAEEIDEIAKWRGWSVRVASAQVVRPE